MNAYVKVTRHHGLSVLSSIFVGGALVLASASASAEGLNGPSVSGSTISVRASATGLVNESMQGANGGGGGGLSIGRLRITGNGSRSTATLVATISNGGVSIVGPATVSGSDFAVDASLANVVNRGGMVANGHISAGD